MKKTKGTEYAPAARAALTGILAGVTLALAFIERLLCAGLPLPPGVRPGISNVAVMFACAALGLPFAMGIAVIKSGFIMLVSGFYAGVISFSGGALSVLSVWLMLRLFSKRLSFTGISVISAVLHNAGQTAAASLLVGSALYMYWAPVLLISGIAFGAVTGTLLNVIMPALMKTIPFLKITNNKSEETIWEKQDPTPS